MVKRRLGRQHDFAQAKGLLASGRDVPVAKGEAARKQEEENAEHAPEKGEESGPPSNLPVAVPFEIPVPAEVVEQAGVYRMKRPPNRDDITTPEPIRAPGKLVKLRVTRKP